MRRAEIEDCEALAYGMKVVVDEDRWLATQPPASAAELTERFRGSIQQGNLLFVLVDGEEVVGALGLNPTSAAGVLGLGMWILPGWRGKGGGHLLVEAALAARPPEVHKIELEVFPDNVTAIRLYEATGFEPEGLRRDHYRRTDGSLRSALIMARLFPAE